MGYETYPNYKASDMDWLPEIPEHWKIMRLRFVIDSNPTKSEVSGVAEETLVSFLPMEAIGEYGSISLEEEKEISDVYKGYTYFKENDLVVAKITPCFENGKGAIAAGLSNGIGFGTTELHVIRTHDELNKQFAFYLSMSHTFRSLGAAEMLGAGGQKRVPEDFIKNFVIGLPSVEEQIKIANFLDNKTAQIDQLIEKRQELIEKLNEKRAAIITKAVSKGLDNSVKMKDSGVEWLEKMPEHWEVRRLKFLADDALQYGANEAAVMTDREQPRFIRITDVLEDGTLDDDTFRSIPEEVAEPYLLDEGDILLARSGATVGKSFKYAKHWGTAAFAGYLIRFRVNDDVINQDFAYDYFKSAIYWANINSTLIQATIQNFSAEKYSNIILPLPPKEEQEAISEYISEELRKLDKAQVANERMIEKLQEYRTAIITAAVTGKIDVRDFALKA